MNISQSTKNRLKAGGKTNKTPSCHVLKPIALGLAISVLSACTSLQSTGQQSARPASSNAQASQPITNNSQVATEIPVIENSNAEEQRALIDAINRDGQQASYSGFREVVPTPETIDGEDVVELNYEQAELRLVLEELANALDISLVIDPTIDTQVSIRTSPNRPLQRDDIWPLIRLLTRDAGVVLERAGDVYNARRVTSNLTAEIATPETLGDGTAARVMQVTPLVYVSTDAVIEAIAPLLEPNGGVSQLGNGNLLLLGVELSASSFLEEAFVGVSNSSLVMTLFTLASSTGTKLSSPVNIPFNPLDQIKLPSTVRVA